MKRICPARDVCRRYTSDEVGEGRPCAAGTTPSRSLDLDLRRSLGELANAWKARYGFSDAEASTFLAALLGLSREAIAARRRVAAETLRSQVHGILAKTGDARLADAVIRALLELLANRGEQHTTATPPLG